MFIETLKLKEWIVNSLSALLCLSKYFLLSSHPFPPSSPLCVCVCMCALARTCSSAGVCTGQRLMLGISLYCCSCCYRNGSLTEFRANQWAGLIVQWATGSAYLCPPTPPLNTWVIDTRLSHRCWGSELMSSHGRVSKTPSQSRLHSSISQMNFDCRGNQHDVSLDIF